MRSSGCEVLLQGRNALRLLEGMGTSLSIALASMALSIVFGTALGVVMTHRHPLVRVLTRLYLEFVRIMPQLVLLFVVFFSLSTQLHINVDAKVAAVVVFVVWGTAEMGDLVRGAIESIPRHQVSSGLALGLSRRAVMRRIVLPQTVRRLLPSVMNLTARMIMTTSLVVLIGVVEVLKTGQQIIDANRFTHPDAALWVYGAIFLLYFLSCWPLSLLSRRLERKWNS